MERPITSEQRAEVLREAGANYYRLGEYADAARSFYEALQFGMKTVDQWLLKVAMDQMGDNIPQLPKQYLFPVAPKPSSAGLLVDFKDIAPELGVDRFDGNGTCAWSDFDGDGDMDLFLAGSQEFMAVFRNDKGKFKDMTEAVGLAKVPSGYSLNLVDYDNDGRQDLYLSFNGWSGPMPNRLYRNVGGRFEDVSAKSGAADPGDGFVSLWGDLDNDGWVYFIVVNGVLKEGSVLQAYRNNRDGTFTNMTKQAGLEEPPTHGGIGAASTARKGTGSSRRCRDRPALCSRRTTGSSVSSSTTTTTVGRTS
jgi:hypothetical protein